MSTGCMVTVWRWAVAHRLRFQRFELKLGWCTGTAAGPHAWPLALSRRGLFFTTFTTRVVHSGAKLTGKRETWAAAGVTS